MTWREEMRPASFRGVGFFVERGTTVQELHADEHAFARRTDPAKAVSVAKLGVGARRFQVRAFLVGDDYMAQRDELEAALADQSSGRLVHPWRGERTVDIVGRVTTEERKERGGYCVISFECVEAADAGLRSEVDTAAAAETDLDTLQEEAGSDFAATLEDADVPSAYMGSVSEAWEGVEDALEDAHRTITNALGVVDDFTERVEDFSSDIAGFASAPGAAVNALIGALGAVAELPGEVFDAAEQSLETILAAGEEVARAFRPLLEWGADAVEAHPVTPDGENAERLRQATFRAIRHGAFAATARGLLSVPFGSRDRALEARTTLDDAAESLLLDEDGPGGISPTSPAVYAAFVASQTSIAAHLARVAAAADEAVDYTLQATAPALVVAHELYGDATRAPEIVARNDPPHPGQIPAGTVLEVLR